MFGNRVKINESQDHSYSFMSSARKPFSDSASLSPSDLKSVPVLCHSSGVIVWVLVEDAQNHSELKKVAPCHNQSNLSVMVMHGAWLQRCDSWANIRVGFTVDPWWCWQLVCCPSHWVLLSTSPLVLFTHLLQFWKRRHARAPETHIQTQSLLLSC